MIFTSLIQSTQDIKEIISTNDATIQGILLAVILALSGVVIYLYKDNKNLREESYKELKESFNTVLKMNQQYHEYATLMDRMHNKNKD